MTTLVSHAPVDRLAGTLPPCTDVLTFDATLTARPEWHRHRVTVLFPPRTPAAAAQAVACALSGVAPGAVVVVPGSLVAAVEPVVRRYAARLLG